MLPGFSCWGDSLAVAAGSEPLMALEIATNPPTARASTSSRMAPTKSRRRRYTGLTGFRAGCPLVFALADAFGPEPCVPELPCLTILLG